MKTFDRLKKKIKDDTGLELYDFKRTRHGKFGLSCGGFSWVAKDKKSGCTVGSGVNATELLKKDKIIIIENIYNVGFTELN